MCVWGGGVRASAAIDASVHQSIAPHHLMTHARVCPQLTAGEDAETRTLHHLHFTAWPDHGVPSDATRFLALLTEYDRLKALVSDRASYTAVHCSAGVGRTGVFILVDIMMEKVCATRRYVLDRKSVV